MTAAEDLSHRVHEAFLQMAADNYVLERFVHWNPEERRNRLRWVHMFREERAAIDFFLKLNQHGRGKVMGRDAVGNAVGLWAMTMINIWDHMETSVEKLSVLFHFICHNPMLCDRLRQ